MLSLKDKCPLDLGNQLNNEVRNLSLCVSERVCFSLSLSLSLAVSMTGFSELLYLQRPKNEKRNSKKTLLKFTNLRNITNPIPCSSLTPLQLHFPLLFPLATEVTSLNESFFFSLVHTHTQCARKPDKTPYNPHLLFFFLFFLLLSPPPQLLQSAWLQDLFLFFLSTL